MTGSSWLAERDKATRDDASRTAMYLGLWLGAFAALLVSVAVGFALDAYRTSQHERLMREAEERVEARLAECKEALGRVAGDDPDVVIGYLNKIDEIQGRK